MPAESERVLAWLRRGPARAADSAHPGVVLLEAEGRGALSTRRAVLAALARQGLIARTGDRISLAAGRPDPLGALKPEVAAVALDGPDGGVAELNLAESPLAVLARRRDAHGAPFLTPPEVAAGERLRADFTRGQLSPRLGANWSAVVASGRRSGGVADLTDAALSARLRVDAALEAVGPELGGVVLDVCCFLKGLERVEAERGWPARSAKLMLKTGLSGLARHYAPPAGPSTGRVRRWGSADYRPKLSGAG